MNSFESGISQGRRGLWQRSSQWSRAPWRRGIWSRVEVATALQARRAELLRALSARGDARGLSETVLEEVVDDAIGVVVMMQRPISSEGHLMGAFWTTARILLRQHHEGRHRVRLGSRSRVGLEVVTGWMTSDELGPEEVLDLKDRAARAADFVSQLSETEREVVAVMATRGAGLKLTARTLGMPVKAVKSAQRSARAKLDRVALIAAAGRMCHYRERPIIAYARGSADPEVERVARTHLAACAPCRTTYAKLLREMRVRDFQRDAAAAFLPVPAISLDHHFGLAGRMLGWLTSRPRLGGDRVAEALGGAGAVKVAATGSAVVVATATLAGVSPPILPHTTPKSLRKHVAIHRHLARDAGAGNPVTAIVAIPSQTVTAASRAQSAPRRLTSREHAELEFSSLRSPHSGASDSYKRSSASIAEVHTSTQSAEAERSGASEGSSSAASSGASQAAREFGQP